MPTSSLLLYGNDPVLLHTRQLILSREGYAVTLASRPSEFKYLLANRFFDLLIVCQTVGSAECDALLAFAEGIAPGLECLVMTRGEWLPRTRPHPTFNPADGPAQLTARIATLVARKPTPIERPNKRP